MRNTNITETMKYIVEGPVPKNGQKASSGGIRKNGKLQAQYKDPIPYVEPTPPAAVKLEDRITRQIKEDIKSLLWREVGEPLLRKGLHIAIEKITIAFEMKHESPPSIRPAKAPDTFSQPKCSSYTAENLIRFPLERVS